MITKDFRKLKKSHIIKFLKNQGFNFSKLKDCKDLGFVSFDMNGCIYFLDCSNILSNKLVDFYYEPITQEYNYAYSRVREDVKRTMIHGKPCFQINIIYLNQETLANFQRKNEEIGLEPDLGFITYS